ncbi:MAG TPA: DUF6458 family protein [Actinomycetota bacterium]|nr:DUF6458 family protein [Actinomycetota bacterium]
MVGIGLGIFLLAIGAILTWAVEFEVAGIDIATLGVILMIVGVIALIGALVAARRTRTVVDDRHVV